MSHTSQGMVDTDGFKKIDAAAQKVRKLVEIGAFTKATEEWANTQGVVLKNTYNVDFYNILTKRNPGSNYLSAQDASSLSRGIQANNIITFCFIRLHWRNFYSIFNINIKAQRTLKILQDSHYRNIVNYYVLLCISFLCIIAGVMYPDLDQSEAFSLESLMNGPVREALGIQVTHGIQSNDVFNYLRGDFMKPVTHIGINQIYRKNTENKTKLMWNWKR